MAIIADNPNFASDDISDEAPKTIDECLDALSQDIRDFCLPPTSNVPEITLETEENWNALKFYREWVACNRPVIFRRAVKHWPAFNNWKDNQYLRDKVGSKIVTASVTPNGYADAALPLSDEPLKDAYQFVMPHEESMTVNEFLNILEASPKTGPNYCDYGIPDNPDVYYVQKQNSNLTDEWKDILDDIEEISWATEAFGKSPDAINFWMGDSRAVTSTHKDPYENMYAVLRGYKDIILYPPSDSSFMPYKQCKQSKFQRCDVSKNDSEIHIGADPTTTSKFSIVDVDEKAIPWIVIDPLKPNLSKHPRFSKSSPFHLRLNAGDLLYLPSLWFHHLRQSHGCIAVNFWYDMDYGPLYAYQNFLKNVIDAKEIQTKGED